MLVRRVIPGGQLSLSKYGDGKPREPGAGLVTRRGVPGASPGMVPCPAVVPQRCVGAAGAAQALGVPGSRGLARARATAAALQSVCGSSVIREQAHPGAGGGGIPLGHGLQPAPRSAASTGPFSPLTAAQALLPGPPGPLQPHPALPRRQRVQAGPHALCHTFLCHPRP